MKEKDKEEEEEEEEYAKKGMKKIRPVYKTSSSRLKSIHHLQGEPTV